MGMVGLSDCVDNDGNDDDCDDDKSDDEVGTIETTMATMMATTMSKPISDVVASFAAAMQSLCFVVLLPSDSLPSHIFSDSIAFTISAMQSLFLSQRCNRSFYDS